jgi:serine/threonine-protein kinase
MSRRPAGAAQSAPTRDFGDRAAGSKEIIMNLRSTGMAIGITVGAFVVGALLMNFVVMPLVIHQRGSVIVPDVRGMSEQQATQLLERLALEVRVERRQHESEIPEGYVVSQRPRPNDTVKERRTIALTLSLGATTQRVPDLKDLSLRQGRLVLGQHKLQTGRIARVLHEGDARETVLACSPGSGEQVAEGAEVNLLVGVGGQPSRYLMPDLEGQDLLFIRGKLEKLGFRIGNVRYEPRRDVYPNTIVGQAPPAGVMIRQGDSIELVASGTE